MDQELLDSVQQILARYDVLFDRDAFADPAVLAELQAFVEEYLGPETLLSKEEAAQYAALVKSGEADALVSSQDISHFHEISDQELQDAIISLKQSTASIEKQTEVLKIQQNAMKSLVKKNTDSQQTRRHVEERQLQEWDTERAQIELVVEDLSQNLKYQLLELEQQYKASETDVKKAVDNLLRSDDKLLSSLQKLASDLDSSNPEDENNISRIRGLCARLIKYTVEGVRTKLDRIYLAALTDLDKSQTNGADGQEISDLQEELESLYAEILPVAQMSVEQQYLEPALAEVASRETQRQDRSVIAAKYIKECMEFLVSRLEALLGRAEESQYHQIALKYMIDTIKTELADSESSIPPSKTPLSPTKRYTHKQSKSLSLQTPKKPYNRRRSSTNIEDDIEPEQLLIRSLGISAPDASSSDDQALGRALTQALKDRKTKLHSQNETAQASIESSISSHVQEARAAMQLLRSTLLSETPYGKIRLLDADTEEIMDMAEEEIRSAEQRLKAVDLKELQAKNVSRDAFVERWA